MINSIISVILSPLTFFLFGIVWAVVVILPFSLLEYFAIGLELIATGLPKLLLFGSAEISLNKLPSIFLSFSLIAIFLWLIMFVVVYIKIAFQSDERGRESFKNAIKYSFLSWIYVFLIPVFIFSIYLIIDLFLNLVGNKTNDSNIGKMLFLSLTPPSVSKEQWQQIANDNYIMSFSVYTTIVASNQLQLFFITFFLGILAYGLLFAYLYASLVVVGKVFDQAVLFFISPFIAVSAINDGGERLKMWRNQFVQKSLVVFSIIITSKIFVSLLSFVINNIDKLTGVATSGDFFTNLPNNIAILIVTLGGGWAFVESGNLIGMFLGEGASIREGRAASRALLSVATSGFGIGKVVEGAKKISKSSVNVAKTGRNIGTKIGSKINNFNKNRMLNEIVDQKNNEFFEQNTTLPDSSILLVRNISKDYVNKLSESQANSLKMIKTIEKDKNLTQFEKSKLIQNVNIIQKTRESSLKTEYEMKTTFIKEIEQKNLKNTSINPNNLSKNEFIHNEFLQIENGLRAKETSIEQNIDAVNSYFKNRKTKK